MLCGVFNRHPQGGPGGEVSGAQNGPVLVFLRARFENENKGSRRVGGFSLEFTYVCRVALLPYYN